MAPPPRPRPTPALPAVFILTLALLVTSGVQGAHGVEAGGAPRTSAAAPFVAEWSWPLAPAPRVLRPFEKPPRPWQRGHRGVDLAAPAAGSPGGDVLSPTDGVVSFAGTVVDRGVLSIDHGNGFVSSFEPVRTDLVKGQQVLEGQVVAALTDAPGTSGPFHCASRCLHWGVREDGEYVDPLGFVLDRRPSVLLPLGP